MSWTVRKKFHNAIYTYRSLSSETTIEQWQFCRSYLYEYELVILRQRVEARQALGKLDDLLHGRCHAHCHVVPQKWPHISLAIGCRARRLLSTATCEPKVRRFWLSTTASTAGQTRETAKSYPPSLSESSFFRIIFWRCRVRFSSSV